MQYEKLKFSHCSGVKKVQKKCCSVTKQKQHKQKYYKDNFSIILEFVKELYDFGFTNEQILHLANNVRKGRKEREKWNTKQCGGN